MAENEAEMSEDVIEAKPHEVEAQEDEVLDQKEKLAFPTAAIVRVMRKHLDGEKMIRKEVKVAMNKWLERLCSMIAKSMNKYPYVVMNLHEFKESIKMFEDIEAFDKEKERILAHMDAIKKDIQRLERDLGKVEQEMLIH